MTTQILCNHTCVVLLISHVSQTFKINDCYKNFFSNSEFMYITAYVFKQMSSFFRSIFFCVDKIKNGSRNVTEIDL